MDEAVMELARSVRAAGGRAFLVGGCVRDALAGIEAKDFDVEVFGVPPERLQRILGEKFRLDLVGAAFGVLKIHGHDIDVALPRRESKRGIGHRGFYIDSDPSLSVAEAASRRDFTLNAIYYDPLADCYEDPFGGREDLQKRILRHVSEKFAEDPLRVLRGMQFAARFDLRPVDETLQVCRQMTIEDLPPERLFEEWKKLLLKGVKISEGLKFLRATGWVNYFPELKRLIGCKQAPEWHPEGDVWNHTCCCLDAYAGEGEPDLIVGLAVLCHDFGKPFCSAWNAKKQRICSPGHDVAGERPTLSFLRRLTNEEAILREVPKLVKCHMAPFSMWKQHAGEAAIRRLSLKVGSIRRLLRVCAADDAGRPPFPREPEALNWLAEAAERLRVKDAAPKPLIRGRDLLALGMKPGREMGAVLARCFEAQLDGKFATREAGLEWVQK